MRDINLYKSTEKKLLEKFKLENIYGPIYSDIDRNKLVCIYEKGTLDAISLRRMLEHIQEKYHYQRPIEIYTSQNIKWNEINFMCSAYNRGKKEGYENLKIYNI